MDAEVLGLFAEGWVAFGCGVSERLKRWRAHGCLLVKVRGYREQWHLGDQGQRVAAQGPDKIHGAGAEEGGGSGIASCLEMCGHGRGIGAGGEAPVNANKPFLTPAVDIVHGVAQGPNRRTHVPAQSAGALSPARLEQEPRAGGEGHTVEAGVQVKRCERPQESGDGAGFGSCLVVVGVAREAELDIFPRCLAYDVRKVAAEVIAAARATAGCAGRDGVARPGSIGRSAVGIGVWHQVPGDPPKGGVAGRQALEPGHEAREHQRADRLIRVAAGDQTRTQRPRAEPIARDASSGARGPEIESMARSGCGILGEDGIDVEQAWHPAIVAEVAGEHARGGRERGVCQHDSLSCVEPWRTMIEINRELRIPRDELTFTASRSAGPGGQHVNKVSSRVTLRFSVDSSPSLDDAQRERLHARLATRITKRGVLWVHAQRHRSQSRNRDAALARFAELLRDALAEEPERRPTRTPPRARRMRRADKQRRSQTKALRKTPEVEL